MNAACDTVNDIGAIYDEFGLQVEDESNIADKLCNPKIPSLSGLYDQLPKESSIEEATEQDRDIYQKFIDWKNQSSVSDAHGTEELIFEDEGFKGVLQGYLKEAKIWSSK